MRNPNPNPSFLRLDLEISVEGGWGGGGAVSKKEFLTSVWSRNKGTPPLDSPLLIT